MPRPGRERRENRTIADRMHAETSIQVYVGMGIRYAIRPLPSLEELRDYYGVSRATAYRYLNALRAARGEMSSRDALLAKNAMTRAFRKQLALTLERSKGEHSFEVAGKLAIAVAADKALRRSKAREVPA